MNSVVVSAKTLDEAITTALLQLGASSEQVEIEVLEEGGKGFMGILRKEAKIRATLKNGEEPVIDGTAGITSATLTEEPEEEEAPEEVSVEETPAETAPIEEARTVTGEKVVIDDTIEKRLREANLARQNGEERPQNTERQERYGRRNNRHDENLPEKPVYETPVYEIPEDSEAVQEKAKAFLVELLGAMGIEATVNAAFSEEGILEITMEGENMGVIIGKRGATLDSIQYLCTLVINKGRADHVRIKLDTEGYRGRRQETLETLALNLAKKVKRTGHRVVLEPMNPYERRIIHSILQADRAVETHSDGEEPYRKVIISPRRRR